MDDINYLPDMLLYMVYFVVSFSYYSFLFENDLSILTWHWFFSESVMGLNLISIYCCGEGHFLFLSIFNDFFSIVFKRNGYFLNHRNSILPF